MKNGIFDIWAASAPRSRESRFCAPKQAAYFLRTYYGKTWSNSKTERKIVLQERSQWFFFLVIPPLPTEYLTIVGVIKDAAPAFQITKRRAR